MKKITLLLALAIAPALSTAGAAQIAVLSNNVEEKEIGPGSTYTGAIRVKNTTSEPQEAKVYQTDYHFSADGRTEYGAPGSVQRSNAAWVTLNPTYITVPAGEEVLVNYRVNVPAAAAAPLIGTFWSMVMVEGIKKGSAESSAGGAGRNVQVQMGIQPTIRYAVQIVTHIAGTGERKVEFAGTQVVGSRGGGKTLELDVLNTGERAYRPEVWVELFNAQGTQVGTFRSTRGLIYPNTSVHQSFDLGAIPAGTYQALVAADAGGESVFGAQYTLTF